MKTKTLIAFFAVLPFVSTSSFVYAELESVTDSSLSSISGQSGLLTENATRPDMSNRSPEEVMSSDRYKSMPAEKQAAIQNSFSSSERRGGEAKAAFRAQNGGQTGRRSRM